MVDDEIDKYKDHMVDDDSLSTDIKINPDYYIHLAAKSIISSATGDNPEVNMLKLWQITRLFEATMRASGKLPKDYDVQLKNFKESEEYRDANKDKQQYMLNVKKYELCLSVAFDMKASDEPLKLKV